MTRFRGDRAPWQDDAYIDANFEPDNNDARLPIDDATRATITRAATNAGLMFPCGACGGSFWSTNALEVHRERRHNV